MWKRLLNPKQSWILSAAMILVRSKNLSKSCGIVTSVCFCHNFRFSSCLFIYFPLQLLLLNSTVFAYPQESQNLKLRGGSSLSVRVLCCSMTPGICSSSGSLSTLDVPVHLCVLGGHSFMCWLVLCSMMGPFLWLVSSLGTEKMQTLRWHFENGSTTDVEGTWTKTGAWNMCFEAQMELSGTGF